jgi:hypothetical protein
MSETMDTEMRKIIDLELNKTIKKISPKSEISDELNNVIKRSLQKISPKSKIPNELNNKIKDSLKKISPKLKISDELNNSIKDSLKRLSPKVQLPDELKKLLKETLKSLSPKAQVSPEVIKLLINTIKRISPKTKIPKKIKYILKKTLKKISPKPQSSIKLNNLLNEVLKRLSPKSKISVELSKEIKRTLKRISPNSKISSEINNILKEALKRLSPKLKISLDLKDELNNGTKNISPKSEILIDLKKKLIESLKNISPMTNMPEELKKLVKITLNKLSPNAQVNPEVINLIANAIKKIKNNSNEISKKLKKIVNPIKKTIKNIDFKFPKSMDITKSKNNKYNYIIIGGGPTGLTLAWYLAKTNKKVLLIEKESTLGGCHRVQRVDGLFTEHGPRVYSNSYLNFIDLLKDMNLDFDDLFTLYDFNITNVGGKNHHSLTNSEKVSFILAFIRLTLFPSYGKDISILKFMENNNFTEESKEYIDRVCRLTDGATSDTYTLFQFLELVDQQIIYDLYQPMLPNDRGLIKVWQEKLLSKNNIDILLNHEVIKLESKNNKIISVIIKDRITLNQYNITGKKFIITLPPKPMIQLLKNSNEAKNAFGNIKILERWGLQNSYFDYIPITLHWNKQLDLPKVQGFPSSDWGLAFIVLSNYMDFNDKIELENSQTVISTCITFPENISKNIKKTAHECSIDEINNEVLAQLRLSFPELPIPDRMILSPQVYKDTIKNKWVNIDTAYVATNDNTVISNKSKLIKNLYNCGTHNGKSNYNFTSMESAVSNAIYLVNKLQPKLNIQLKETKHVTNYIYFIFLILVIYIYAKLNI